ncbi:MAG: radical SAM protein [Verrucomicrobiota bacterium]|nr:radical SAM protein [Verrucomicrobiota bacterium]
MRLTCSVLFEREQERHVLFHCDTGIRGAVDPKPMITPSIPSLRQLYSAGTQQREFHERASTVARHFFGHSVFIRGVVEVSNFCRQNCSYCGMRRENRDLERFRSQHDQIAELLLHHRPASMTDVNIQAGEDPIAVREIVLPLIRTLKRESSLGISVCLGSLNASVYQELQRAGASIYILKFETGDPSHFLKMQSPGSLSQRTEHIRMLGDSGWKVSSGFIAGLPGQGERELLANFQLAAELPLAGCSVSPFVPGEETPLAHETASGIDLPLNCMAALRIMRPDWIIPAVSALNLADPIQGYRRGLRTGANLVTINLTPSDVREDYLLYKRERFIMTEERILEAIDLENLKPSKIGLADYYRRQATSERAAA